MAYDDFIFLIFLLLSSCEHFVNIDISPNKRKMFTVDAFNNKMPQHYTHFILEELAFVLENIKRH